VDLILWRHAEAEAPGSVGLDNQRPLTKRGLRHAERTANWLDRRLPETARVISSPARRCTQTADLLPRRYKIRDELAVQTSVIDVLTVLRWPTLQRPTLLIGHQPWIGELVANLLGSPKCDIHVSRGSVIWLRSKTRDGVTETHILTVQNPRFL
jgi:phosphohistidine phosphatase